MRVVALVSGGKDSCFNMMQCVAEGHEIVALANLYPKGKDELDSYMYQTVGHQGIEYIAQAMQVPLFRKQTNGKSEQREKNYVPVANDEVEDLYDLLTQVKDQLDFDAISVGAILSDYQRVRVENVCIRLGLISLAYLWRREQRELLQEMIDTGIHAIIIKVASLGLIPDLHLGLSLKEIQPHLLKMADKFGLNVCGEGGEYESFTLDCPLYKKRISIENTQRVISNSDQVGYMNFLKLNLVDKAESRTTTTTALTKVKSSLDYVADIFEDSLNDTDHEELEQPGNGREYDGSMVGIDLIEEDEMDFPMVTNMDVGEQLSPNAFARGIASMETGDTIPVPNNRPNAVRNNLGWLWMGGIQGFGTDIEMAVGGALQTLEDQIFENNFNLCDIVSINLYVHNMDDYATINKIYADRMNFPNPPIRVCVGIPLPKSCPILLDALAFQPKGAGKMLEGEGRRYTMHVQGMSHWAPANIGPYSQSVRIGDLVYVSGQIPLIPGTMQVIEGGIVPQCKLSLRHMRRIARAMSAPGELRDVVQGTCFLTDVNNVVIARKQWESCTTNAIIDYVIVKSLPRRSLVEWQVWIHKHNDSFEYEETGCTIDKDFTISIRRRWNYENNCAAIVCNISSPKDWNSYYNIRRTISGNEVFPSDLEVTRPFQLARSTLFSVLRYSLDKLLEGYRVKEPAATDDLMSGGSYKRQTSISQAKRTNTPTVYLKVFYHVHLSRQVSNFPTFIVDTLNEFKSGSVGGALEDDTNSEMGTKVNYSFTAVPVYGLCNKFTFLSINGIRHD